MNQAYFSWIRNTLASVTYNYHWNDEVAKKQTLLFRFGSLRKHAKKSVEIFLKRCHSLLEKICWWSFIDIESTVEPFKSTFIRFEHAKQRIERIQHHQLTHFNIIIFFIINCWFSLSFFILHYNFLFFSFLIFFLNCTFCYLFSWNFKFARVIFNFSLL
jgi:hypothetical protein